MSAHFICKMRKGGFRRIKFTLGYTGRLLRTVVLCGIIEEHEERKGKKSREKNEENCGERRTERNFPTNLRIGQRARCDWLAYIPANDNDADFSLLSVPCGFLDASSHLYKRPCPSVRPLVRPLVLLLFCAKIILIR